MCHQGGPIQLGRAGKIAILTGGSLGIGKVTALALAQEGAPEDIADLILFLVSERASAITGQVIAVDGRASRGIVY